MSSLRIRWVGVFSYAGLIVSIGFLMFHQFLYMSGWIAFWWAVLIWSIYGVYKSLTVANPTLWQLWRFKRESVMFRRQPNRILLSGEFLFLVWPSDVFEDSDDEGFIESVLRHQNP